MSPRGFVCRVFCERPLNSVRKNVGVLAACQALLFTNNTTIIALSALIGAKLAPVSGLSTAYATVPAMFWVIGAAVAAMPAAHLMKAVGRRAGFTVGPFLGITGALIVSAAIYFANFFLFCLGTLIYGAYNGFAQQYRFAAADASPHDFKARAISYVLAGGLVGGVLGPELSKFTKDIFGPDLEYLGSVISLIGIMVVVIFLLRLLDIPNETHAESKEPMRPTREIVSQPAFIVAVVAAAMSYAVMNLLMVSSPLAMTVLCGHPYSAAASVIGFHVIGMFLPSFFTGDLIKKFGVRPVMFAGVVLNFVTVGIALSGVTVAHFWWSMFILGVGWNFVYIGATAMLTETYRPSERAKAQGINEFCIFSVMVVTAFSSGFLLDGSGWELLNYISIVLISIIAVMLAWFALRRVPSATAV
jgi:MFS family permease